MTPTTGYAMTTSGLTRVSIPMWRTGHGVWVSPSRMTTEHLRNAINRMACQDESRFTLKWLPILHAELKSRADAPRTSYDAHALRARERRFARTLRRLLAG